MFLRLFLLISLLSPLSHSSSEHRLIGRILSVSDSKKTFLFNRGSEDGLKLENHAKISLPEGIMARAVLIRIAPSRSVWSIYKFYQKDKVIENIIVTIKTTPPLKLTRDSSKAIDLLPPDSRSQQEKTSKKLKVIKVKKDKKIIHQFDKIDYSALDDLGKPQKLDPTIDWNNLQNLHRPSKKNPHVDFSNLY